MPAKFQQETEVSNTLWQISHNVLQVATEILGKVGGKVLPAWESLSGKVNPQIPTRMEKYIWYIFEAHDGMVILYPNFILWRSIWNE